MLVSLKQRWQAHQDKPFARLVRHSITRVFSGSEGTEQGELDLSIGAVLAILAAPGAFVAVILSDRYGSLFRWLRGQPAGFDVYAASASDEYFFILLAMVITAAVAIWKWEQLLPDRRDFVNFEPLPIASRKIFFANLAAVLLLAALLSIDVNAVSFVLFPMFVTAQATFVTFLKFLITHVAAVLVAGAFGFLSVLAILGAMMSILSFRVFRKASFYVRCGLLFYLAALLTTGFTEPNKFHALAAVAHPWTRVPPPAWFLGLCQSMRGRAQAPFESFSGAAICAFLLALFFSAAGFALSYRRCYLQSAEQVEVGSLGSHSGFAFRWLDASLLKSPLERGSYRFAVRTLFRSPEHAFVFGAFTTFGILLASQNLFHAFAVGALKPGVTPSAEILSLPLILGFFLVLGFYSAFSIPAPLRSNWIFRFHVDPKARDCGSLARKIVFTFLIPFLFVPCFAASSYLWGWRIGLLHTALVAAWCALLLGGLLVKFRKIPFTCSLPGFKSHAIVIALLILLLFYAFTSVTAQLESWVLPDPVYFVVFIPIAGGLLTLFIRQRKGLIESDRRLTFEEKSAPVVESMNLVR